MFTRKQDGTATQKTDGYTPPEDVNVAILHTIIAVTALRDVLQKETAALKEANTALFLDLQDEKVEAARRYEKLVNALMDRGAAVKSADAKLKDRLQKLQGDFSAVAEENLSWIKRMEKATKALGETIMRAARKSAESQTQFAYGASGKMQRGGKAMIGLDERA